MVLEAQPISRSEAQCISTLFRLPAAAGISTLYLVLGPLILIPDAKPPAFPIVGAHGIPKEILRSAF